MFSSYSRFGSITSIKNKKSLISVVKYAATLVLQGKKKDRIFLRTVTEIYKSVGHGLIRSKNVQNVERLPFPGQQVVLNIWHPFTILNFFHSVAN